MRATSKLSDGAGQLAYGQGRGVVGRRRALIAHGTLRSANEVNR